MEWKPGDVVVLKSGGPPMTVEGPDDDEEEYECVWFHRKKTLRDVFPPEALERYKPKG